MDKKSSAGNRERESWALSSGGAYLAPGYILVPEFSSRGGSTSEDYHKQVVGNGGEPGEKKRHHKGGGVLRRVSYVEKVDDPVLQDATKSTLSQARNSLTKRAVNLFAGTYFIPVDEFAEVDAELQSVRRQAHKYNRSARAIKSNRFTTIDVYPFLLDVADRKLSLRIGASIHDRLVMLRQSYSAESRRAYQSAMMLCDNLEKLVLGKQQMLIRDALASSRAQRQEMRVLVGSRKGRKEVMEKHDGKPSLNFDPIDRAIEAFAPSFDSLLALGSV